MKRKLMVILLTVSLPLGLAAPALAAGSDASLVNLGVNAPVALPVKLLTGKDSGLINLKLNVPVRAPINLLGLIKLDLNLELDVPLQIL